MRMGVVHMPVRFVPAADLTGALCAGDTLFTAEKLDRIERAHLIATCDRCPVLTACAADRDRFREESPWAWAQFTGVWAGQAYTRVKPYVGQGNRR